MYEPKYSIIIPHFNTPNLLRKLLCSIPNTKDYQVIVVDDNSTEQCVELEEVKSEFSFVEFYKNTGVKGAGSCRNIGLNYIKGKWLIFADSDDFFSENFKQLTEDYFNSKSDIIYFKPFSVYLDTFEPASRHIPYLNLVKKYSEMRSLYNEIRLRYEFVVPWSKMFRSEIVQKNNIRFDELIVSNDIMFSVKAAYYAHTIAVSCSNIYIVTRSKNTLTMSISEINFDTRLAVGLKKMSFLCDHLAKNEFIIVRRTLLSYVFLAYKYFGFRKAISVFIQLKKDKVSFIGVIYLNPIDVWNKIKDIKKIMKDLNRFGSIKK